MSLNLETTANQLVAEGKGILAADESTPTITRRFAAVGVESTAENRRAYREMLFTTPGIAESISGVILYDETIHQKDARGVPFAEGLAAQGIVPGIKVDLGATPLAGSPDERVTEGLDGLRERLTEYRGLGARFAKWRAVIRIGGALPSPTCLAVNAEALARYAALCQEGGLVPIVEPEVLMDGDHDIQRCEAVTGEMLHRVFAALWEQRVTLEEMLLKPNMVISGKEAAHQAPVGEVATATVRCLRRHVPAAVPGIVFLSGGQSARLATEHLNAINVIGRPLPWAASFSYGRALQDAALHAWHGDRAQVPDGQRAFAHRARCTGAAAAGRYDEAMESAGAPARHGHRHDE